MIDAYKILKNTFPSKKTEAIRLFESFRSLLTTFEKVEIDISNIHINSNSFMYELNVLLSNLSQSNNKTFRYEMNEDKTILTIYLYEKE